MPAHTLPNAENLIALVPLILARRFRGQGSAVLTALRAVALLDGVGFAEP
jgi:hypothetical protein